MHPRCSEILGAVAEYMAEKGAPFEAQIFEAKDPHSRLVVDCGPPCARSTVWIDLGNFTSRKSLAPLLARIKRELGALEFENAREDMDAYLERRRVPKLSHEEMETLLA